MKKMSSVAAACVPVPTRNAARMDATAANTRLTAAIIL
jgi:hypothetical protein